MLRVAVKMRRTLEFEVYFLVRSIADTFCQNCTRYFMFVMLS